MTKYAVKLQSENPNNLDNIPDHWPWKRIAVTDEEAAAYIALGWTIFTDAELQEYMNGKSSSMQKFFLDQVYTSENFWNISIEKRIEFSKNLIERFKKRNIDQSINAAQALWMHSRVRALEVTFAGLNLQIDIMNLVISGDIEVATLALLNCIPDDGSRPYHWLTAERLNWLITEMKTFLGWK